MNGPPRHGYILLVTLGLLVLSATLLVVVGRVAVQHAAQARLDERDLQRKWASASARWAVLPYAEQILVTAEGVQGRPVPKLAVALPLGDDVVTVIVADEQAKANVNEMLGRLPAESVENRVRQALSGTPLFGHVRLRPGPPTTPIDSEPRVGGFGQVFDDVSPAKLFAAPTPPADALTCWGDGGLNLMRAGREAMRMSLAPSLSQLQIEQVLRARDTTFSTPRPSQSLLSHTTTNGDAVHQLLGAAGASPKDRARLPLVARSTCHSVLLLLNDGRRLWYDLSASDESNAKLTRTHSVVW